MTARTSIAMTADVHRRLCDHLLRADGQEDIVLALYRPSTGATRRTALIHDLVLPRDGERAIHGNASITGEYVLRAAALAHADGSGLALCHSHPRGHGWQALSGPDTDAESAYANLAREITGLPLVGMTLAGADRAWSARHWDRATGRNIAATHAENVRVVGDRLTVSWNDALVPPTDPQPSQLRSVASWGERLHADLARRSVLVVGAGSVGLDIASRLAATGITRIGVMDFDTVKERNLDRLIGATALDAWLHRAKIDLARRVVLANATAPNLALDVWEHSICEPDGLAHALDFDIVFSCVDRPWARAVLNLLAHAHYVPVIDGGIGVDAFPDGTGMRGATWRSHVIRPGRPCMACNGQLDLAAVTLDRSGDLDDPAYIAGAGRDAGDRGENVAVLSISAAAAMLSQFVSFNVAPGGIGEPGPLQYILATHTLEHLPAVTRPTCPVEAAASSGDRAPDLTGEHLAAGRERAARAATQRRLPLRAGLFLDRGLERAQSCFTALAQQGSRRRCHQPRIVSARQSAAALGRSGAGGSG